MRVRGIRGATTANENTKESILEATRDLLEKLVEANGIDADDIASALFTSTEDLDAGFPAEAARRMGWQYVALLGSSEVPVPGRPGQAASASSSWSTPTSRHRTSSSSTLEAPPASAEEALGLVDTCAVPHPSPPLSHGGLIPFLVAPTNRRPPRRRMHLPNVSIPLSET